MFSTTQYRANIVFRSPIWLLATPFHLMIWPGVSLHVSHKHGGICMQPCRSSLQWHCNQSKHPLALALAGAPAGCFPALNLGLRGHRSVLWAVASQTEHEVTALLLPMKNRVYRSISSRSHWRFPVVAAFTLK